MNSEAIKYICVKLEQQSSELLANVVRAKFGNSYDKLYCDHLTLAYGASQVADFDNSLFGSAIILNTEGIVYDMNCVAALVKTGDVEDIGCNNENPHITMATNKRTPPVYSNKLAAMYRDGNETVGFIPFENTIRGKIEPVYV